MAAAGLDVSDVSITKVLKTEFSLWVTMSAQLLLGAIPLAIMTWRWNSHFSYTFVGFRVLFDRSDASRNSLGVLTWFDARLRSAQLGEHSPPDAGLLLLADIGF